MSSTAAHLRRAALRLAVLVVLVVATACSGATGGSGDREGVDPDAAAVATPASRTRTGGAGDGAAPAGADRIPAGARQATVTKVTDGDTIRVAVGGADEPVRLIAIDAPEVAGGCGADQATAFVARRVPVGARVWLETDVTDRDRYARLLRYVWTDDGRLLNAAIVRAGWARAKLYEPDDGRWSQLLRAERAAREAGRGIWSRCDLADAEPTGTAPTAPDADGARGGCDPNYSGCVPRHPPDVDCDVVDGPVRVLGADPHNLDGNHDAMGREDPRPPDRDTQPPTVAAPRHPPPTVTPHRQLWQRPATPHRP
jgi:micrococcal nuclease